MTLLNSKHLDKQILKKKKSSSKIYNNYDHINRIGKRIYKVTGNFISNYTGESGQ